MKPQASRAATMPVMNMPSNVPAPPIEAYGVPSREISFMRSKSAPISTPNVPLIYASEALWSGLIDNPTNAALIGAIRIGMPMPSPEIGRLKM